jgi:3D (Asp-Asp-Asp) domain-containing protein
MKIWLACTLWIAYSSYAFAASGWQKFNATAYSVEGETASGKQTREGRTVAADPAALPLGTRIEVRDAGPYSGIYVVHDVGRKINGREIDIFIDNPVEAKKFGKKTVRVRVLAKPGSK